ncbi:MAG: class I SAM-dependent methyltransferase [Phycisphaerales bacterium]|nr:MAG: class I SAM-dependent methyltransferase [Phycisphaerales bacterium]
MVLSRRAYKWFYDHVHSHYYDIVMKYCFLPFGGETKCRAELLAPVEFARGDEILDMCCGTGGATSAIVTKVRDDGRVTGLDLSIGQLRMATRRPKLGRVQLVTGDAACTPFQDACFDKVFITHAIHEMPREARLRVLAEARRILKNGGKVVVLELDRPGSFWVRLFIGLWFFYWLPLNFENPTRRDMLRHGVVEEVREAGFSEVTKDSNYRGVLQVVQGVK